KGDDDSGKAFLAMNVVAADKEVLDWMKEAAMPIPSDDDKITLLCDSGANVRITPMLKDLTAPHPVDRTCTFGNKGQLQARAMGTMELESDGTVGKTTSLALKNVLWVPG
ncbi:unnamed protein product, partial [Discosporangium mesarthrocarpum]